MALHTRHFIPLSFDIVLGNFSRGTASSLHFPPPEVELRKTCDINYVSEYPPPADEQKLRKASSEAKWVSWAERYNKFIAKLDDFPVKKGRKFRAYPIHFSTADIECIRDYLSSSAEYKQMIEWDNDQVIYTLHCRVFPLLGGIVSVWFVIGTQTDLLKPFFD